MDTSPVAVSKNVDSKLASVGTHSSKIFLASSSDFRIFSSVQITILFFMTFTRFEIIMLFSMRNFGLFVYNAILGPS